MECKFIRKNWNKARWHLLYKQIIFLFFLNWYFSYVYRITSKKHSWRLPYFEVLSCGAWKKALNTKKDEFMKDSYQQYRKIHTKFQIFVIVYFRLKINNYHYDI